MRLWRAAWPILSMRATSAYPEILVEIAHSAGLSGEKARAVSRERRFKDRVDADWAKSRAYGLTGVPSFIAARYDPTLRGAGPARRAAGATRRG
jgi:predicted DsbA family dithiol-disulfide isomerase